MKNNEKIFQGFSSCSHHRHALCSSSSFWPQTKRLEKKKLEKKSNFILFILPPIQPKVVFPLVILKVGENK